MLKSYLKVVVQRIDFLKTLKSLWGICEHFEKAIESMPNGGLVPVQIKKIDDTNISIRFVDQGIG
jgi:hypothetical protein